MTGRRRGGKGIIAGESWRNQWLVLQPFIHPYHNLSFYNFLNFFFLQSVLIIFMTDVFNKLILLSGAHNL